MKGKPIYDECPNYQSDRFLLRLVAEADADNLLRCYSDESAVRLMNADNCTSAFCYQTLDQMKACIQDWLASYKRALYVRFSVIDKSCQEAVGTIEMYDKNLDTGILRVDLRSAYETEGNIKELMTLCTDSFYTVFCVRQIATKAIPAASERISALRECGFALAEANVNGQHQHYYVR